MRHSAGDLAEILQTMSVMCVLWRSKSCCSGADGGDIVEEMETSNGLVFW
jgi:hypothetical protein